MGGRREQTALDSYNKPVVWYLCVSKHAYKPLQQLFTDDVEFYGKNLENEPEVPCSQSGEVFSKSHWTNSSRCDMLMHPRRRAQPASPGRARHPDKRALCVGGGDRGDSQTDPERRSRRLLCESGAKHLDNGTSSKIYLDKEECKHGKK